MSSNNFNYLTEKKQLLLRLHNIKYLQVLRTIIHNEIMFTDLKLREQGHNPQKFRRCKFSNVVFNFMSSICFRQSERVQEVQDQIQDFGDGSTITKVASLDKES